MDSMNEVRMTNRGTKGKREKKYDLR